MKTMTKFNGLLLQGQNGICLTLTVHVHKSLAAWINYLCVFVLSCRSFEEIVVHDQEGLKERTTWTAK